MPGGWLTKSEVNRLYYDTVAGDIVFQTEASAGHHPAGVAKLISARARTLGLPRLRVLEIGANDAAFARAVLLELRALRESHATVLERVDYVAVELARGSLERAAAQEEELGAGRRVLRPAAPAPSTAGSFESPEHPTMVALVAVESGLAVNLGLVHAEATQYARENTQTFDVVILNELLDDMPYRAFFADETGRRFEAIPLSREEEGGRWTVRIDAGEPLPGEAPDLPPATMTAHSPECVELVRALAAALSPGGLLLLHDYGFAEPFQPLDTYAGEPPSLPAFAELEYAQAGGAFPRSFFRVFGNDVKHVVQVTNDVNFAELVDALAPAGAVLTLPHGNQIEHSGGRLERGQGTFLSEFPSLAPGDDVAALLDRLERDQASIREAYVRDYLGGRRSVFLDLLFIRQSV